MGPENCQFCKRSVRQSLSISITCLALQNRLIDDILICSDNIDELRKELEALGANHVFTDSELASKSSRKQFAQLTSEAPIKLGLNCVGGDSTSIMAKLLSREATLVTYGAMSMQPLSLPSSLFIFKNLKSRGFWMSDWYNKQGSDSEERVQMTKELIKLIEEGRLKEPKTEIVKLTGTGEEIGEKAREAIKTIKGKKVIFHFPEEQ
jgi:NADPH:quinone reductase-like Zn-dependent oxidoreductase